MSDRRRVSLPVLALLTALVILATVAGQAVQPPSPAGSVPESTDDLLAAVVPDQRNAVVAQARDMPRYTIAATLLLPSESPQVQPATKPEATPQATPVASPQASPIAGPQASPVAPRSASPVASLQATPIGAGADHAQVSAGSDPPAGGEPQIVGTVDLHYVNTTGETLDELYVRLNPNLQQYGSGSMVIANVYIDGVPIEVQPPALHAVPDATPVPIENAGAADLAIVVVPLGAPLADGAAVRVRMDFSTTVPIGPPDENGLFRYTPETGTWTLAHWFPVLAGYDPEQGWDIDPPAVWSDITFANTALFDITLTAPNDLVLVTTGTETGASEQDGFRTTRITTGPVRDVAIVADPNLRAMSVEVGDTTIRSWHRPGEEAGAETILAWAEQAFAVYTERFGPYPYTTLDLVSVPGLIGYEFPQLIFIGADFYPDPELLGSRPGAIEFLVAHEVAHQWWYGLVGSNPHTHAYLDEGLTEYSTIIYFERQHGAEVAAAHLRDGLLHRYAFMLVTTGDQVADQPTGAFPDAGSYYATVYRKAGLGFHAIHEEIGDAAFFGALRSYAEQHRFTVATPEDLLAAFETAAGEDLGDLWALWFESERGGVEIVMEPVPATPPASPPAATPAAPPIATSSGLDASPQATPDRPAPASPVVQRTELATPSASPGASD